MKNIQRLFIVLLIINLILSACGSSSNKENGLNNVDVLMLDDIYNDFLDHPEKYKGKKLKSIFYYDPIYRPGLNELLKLTNGLGMTIKCFRYGTNSNNRMDIIFSLSGNLEVPNVTYLDRIEVEFICSEGSLKSGNEVMSIIRN
jgi:hypothetical protein